MQVFTTEPRQALTEEQVIALIRDSFAPELSFGCELLDLGLNVIADFSDDLIGGDVGRNSYATLHGVGRIQITRELPWGRAIVRPYAEMSFNDVSARFYLGAYFTSTPARVLGTRPLVYDVEMYDVLLALDTPTGQSYSVKSGAQYLSKIQDILESQGFTKFVIDQSRASTTLPSARTWPLEEGMTWLNVVNDLLGAIGYRGIWSDWNGFLRLEPYISPEERGSEWTYDTHPERVMLTPERTLIRDYFETPNQWVAIRNNNVSGPTPVEGNGIYTYVNQNQGETSVQARQRTITRILPVDAADQAALISRAQISIEADLKVRTSYSVSTAINPLHWHFDRLTVDDPEAGPKVEVLGTSWRMPFSDGHMTHTWSEI